MDNKEIFDNYLSTHYSKCEKTNFNNDEEVLKLLNKNKLPIDHNLQALFESKIDKNSKILDLGCGYGSFLYFLKMHGYKDVVGVDISGEEIALCNRFFESYKLSKIDIFDYIGATKEKFDVIYLSHVLEHIKKEQLLGFLETVKNLLNETGFFIIVVPNNASYFNSTANRYGDLTHEIGFTDKSLRQALTLADFRHIEIRNYFGVGNFLLNIARKVSLFFFEILIQIMGYEKQEIYTPSILVIAQKNKR